MSINIRDVLKQAVSKHLGDSLISVVQDQHLCERVVGVLTADNLGLCLNVLEHVCLDHAAQIMDGRMEHLHHERAAKAAWQRGETSDASSPSFSSTTGTTTATATATATGANKDAKESSAATVKNASTKESSAVGKDDKGQSQSQTQKGSSSSTTTTTTTAAAMMMMSKLPPALPVTLQPRSLGDISSSPYDEFMAETGLVEVGGVNLGGGGGGGVVGAEGGAATAAGMGGVVVGGDEASSSPYHPGSVGLAGSAAAEGGTGPVSGGGGGGGSTVPSSEEALQLRQRLTHWWAQLEQALTKDVLEAPSFRAISEGKPLVQLVQNAPLLLQVANRPRESAVVVKQLLLLMLSKEPAPQTNASKVPIQALAYSILTIAQGTYDDDDGDDDYY